jgi:glycine/D-amino acid oxidase-like deaminating enzyme
MLQSSLRVLVIGAGLGGLCLAQGLRKAGVEVAVYERDTGLAVRTQGHRIHIDSRGEQALHQFLPPSLYELFLATRGQPSKGITAQGMPLYQALHDYEIEMLRSGFGTARTSLQAMQRRGPDIPFTPDQGERQGGRGN